MGVFDKISKGLASIEKSVSGSADQIADSGGDFGRAIGRGDFASAGNDLLSIGSEVTNIITGGTLNITYDALKRWTKPEIPEVDYQDRKVSFSDADAPRKLVYGTVRTGGVTRNAEYTPSYSYLCCSLVQIN